MSLTDVQEFIQKPVFTIGDTTVTLSTLAVVILVVIFSMWVSRLAQKAIARFLRLRGVSDIGSIGVASRLMHYAVMFLGLGVALNTVGLDLTALFTAGAFFAVAIGFAMQSITQNFVSGIILLMERTIKPGDILEVEGQVVRIAELGVRSTVARTLSDEDLIIPNSILMQTTVKNYTLKDPVYRLRAEVGVTYDSDMHKVRTVLEECAEKLTWRNHEYIPRVLLIGFGASSVDWEVSVWMDDPFRMRTARSQLNEAIWWALKDSGVVIAFPQMDIHLDPPVQEAMVEHHRRRAELARAMLQKQLQDPEA